MPENYILTSQGNFMSTDELYHYGVLGMKWGVRRGNSAKAYASASKKLTKLNNKTNKALDKAYAKQAKADKKASSFFASQRSARKADFKASKAMRKSVVKARKAQKWLKQMDSTFKNTTESLSQEQVNMGKRYTDILEKRIFQ